MNWMRCQVDDSEDASARASEVLPVPGTSSSSRCPSASRQITELRMTSGLPWMTRPMLAHRRSASWATWAMLSRTESAAALLMVLLVCMVLLFPDVDGRSLRWGTRDGRLHRLLGAGVVVVGDGDIPVALAGRGRSRSALIENRLRGRGIGARVRAAAGLAAGIHHRIGPVRAAGDIRVGATEGHGDCRRSRPCPTRSAVKSLGCTLHGENVGGVPSRVYVYVVVFELP